MYDVSQLPKGDNPEALKFPHFPTRQQAFVWRNWNMVPAGRLAEVLGTDTESVVELAVGMGLPENPRVSPKWMSNGHITVIRANWHLLPYEQLLTLMGWDADKMMYSLKEEDFLFQKLGRLKPRCERIVHAPLTAEEKAATKRLRETVEKYFPDIGKDAEEEPFAFVNAPPMSFNVGGVVTETDKERFDLRLIYPYFAPYGDPFMEDSPELCPDNLLESYARLGVNAIWLQAILHTLVPFERAPEYSEGHERRIKTLKTVVERATRHGVGVFLYFNEPRAMPFKFFEKYPEWRGAENDTEDIYAMCTSSTALQNLRERVEKLFRQVPGLAGAFTITASENFSNCRSHGPLCDGGNFGFKTVAGCPRCKPRPPGEIMAEVNTAIEQGAHAANPEARIVAWTWGWRQPDIDEGIALLPKSVEVMCVSENDMPATIGGVKGKVCDYSISQPGPGPHAARVWGTAKKHGHKPVAKVQVNNTWECSAVPYMPVPGLVLEHLSKLEDTGVKGLMLSWTLGGAPSMNLEIVSEFCRGGARDAKSMLADLSARLFGAEAGPGVQEVFEMFGAAFREFPEFAGGLYLNPQSLGPSNLLYAEPTGYRACMTAFCYDDVERWRGAGREDHEFPADKYEEQFKKVSEGWKAGLDRLLSLAGKIPGELRGNFEDLKNVAAAACCHFSTTRLQIKFIRLRDGLSALEGAKKDEAISEIIGVIDGEAESAGTLEKVMRKDSRIGYEAGNHYFYDIQAVREKILNCEFLKDVFARKIKK